MSTNNIAIYDLLPGWDSYVADVENNLQMDPEGWQKYLDDPAPVLYDILMDFGKFDANSILWAHEIVIKALAQAGYKVDSIKEFGK